jgi:hypothetical protein
MQLTAHNKVNLYIYNEDMFILAVNHMKTNKRINMELRPYDAKSFVDVQIRV